MPRVEVKCVLIVWAEPSATTVTVLSLKAKPDVVRANTIKPDATRDAYRL